MLQKTISGMAGFRCIKSPILYIIPMKKLQLLLPIFLLVGFNVFGQLHYKKRFEKKTFSLEIKTYQGPIIVSLIDNEKQTIDTLAYSKYVRGNGYIVYDAWLENDFLLFVRSQSLGNATIENGTFENGKWEGKKFWPEILSSEEVLQPHEIKIIDRNHIKVTKGGKSYIHTLDYKERKHTVAEENK